MPLPPNTITEDIILASNSPRRRELLQLIVPQFIIAVSKDVDEAYPAEMLAHPEDIPAYLAVRKAHPYRADLQPGEVLITADTVVIVDGEILGKPASADEARSMLHKISGRTHQVVTGVALTTLDMQTTFDEVTDVTFTNLTEGEISLYINNFQPFDKAGAYGIQEWIGCIGITGIRGDFYNVMGLPLQALYKHLKAIANR